MNKLWDQEEEASRLHKRFSDLKASYGVGQAEFARKTNFPGGPSMISQHIKNRRPINLAAAQAYAMGFSCPLEEISPRLAMQVASARSLTAFDPNTSQGPKMRAPVPLISWVQAGEWCGIVDNFAPGDAEEWIPVPRNHGSKAFALRVRGISMEPKYRDGYIIFVDPDRQADHGSNVVVRMDHEAEATFKQLVIEGENKFLRALNPDWPGPKLIEINGNATICGVVIGTFIPD